MGALDGIRVIDFGQWIAGPLAAMLLGDQGAEVIRVDPPGGPRWRSPANAMLDRGKERVVLDLKAAAGRAAARRLIDRADVVVENFRPGVMDRLGLGAGAATRDNPHLVYCSLPGFASDDPRAGLPAWEGVLGAATGTYWQPGGSRFTALPISSTFGALAAAVAIVMALIARERDGAGQRIEVPLFDATVLAIGSSGLLVNGKPDGARPDDPWGGQFECADGRWIRLSLATFRFVRRFVEAAGRRDWIEKGYVHAERPGPLARGTELRARQEVELAALFRTRSAADWEELGRRAEVPITLVRTSAEWLAAEHPMAAGLVARVDDPEYGAMLVPGLAVRLLGTPGAVRPRAADPSRGDGHLRDATAGPRPQAAPSHSAAWSATSGAEPRPRTPDPLSSGAAVSGAAAWGHAPHVDASRSMRGAAAPDAVASTAATPALDGIRVLDLTQVLAGPTAARTLAEFGADVIKINNPAEEGAGYRWQVHRYHTDVNRGKRTMLLDLKQPEGQDVLMRLVDRADVVLHNFRPGVAERLGIDYERMRARRPDVVYGEVGFLGDGGPWASAPGYEPNAQAATGMMARMGGAAGPPAMQPFAPNDYATGLLGAFAMGLALFHRRRTGRGQRVQTSLGAAATLLQSAYLHEYDGKVWDEPAGPEAPGWGALQRLYRASDGWLFLGATEADLGRLDGVSGLAGIASETGPGLAAALAMRFAARPAAEWATRLAASGVGAHAVVSATDLVRDPWAIAHGLSLTRAHADGALITTIGPPARLSRTPVVPGRPVSPPGADAALVLDDVGLAHRLDELVARRIVAIE